MSKRGPAVTVFPPQSAEPVSPELCGGRDPLAEGADGAAGSGQASPELGTQRDVHSSSGR